MALGPPDRLLKNDISLGWELTLPPIRDSLPGARIAGSTAQTSYGSVAAEFVNHFAGGGKLLHASIFIQKSWKMQHQIFLMDNPAKFCDGPPMVSRNEEEHSFKEIGRRIALVRRALGLSQAEMAERLGVGLSRWNNWEVGVNQIPPYQALRLKIMFPGISSDWIYEEDRSRITVEAAEKLDAAASMPDDPVKRRGRPSKRR